MTVKGIFGSKIRKKEARHSAHTCALTGEKLMGVPHGKNVAQVRRMTKSGRRPSVMFGGILSSAARRSVISESAAIWSGAKKLTDVDLKSRKFVEQALLALQRKG